MNKKTRQMAGFFSINEMARMLGVDRQRIKYALSQDYLPRPSHKIGARRYYSKAVVEEVVRPYFAERKSHQRQPDIFEESK
jgi:hypothetical protein